MKKKVLAMLLTGAMAFSMLTGCGKGSGGGRQGAGSVICRPEGRAQ